MSRGDNQRGRGYRGGHRGNGRGRGQYRGRGGGGIRGHSRGGYHTLEEMDEVYLMSENNFYSSGTESPRGRGRGQTSYQNSGFNTPRGRGRGKSSDYQSPRGRGRGGSKLGKDAPLSGLLYQERPLLRPVTFVPSVHTRTLFQEEEEIFQAIVEEVGEEEKSHVPTADRVFRVFSGGGIPQIAPISGDESDSDAIDEIDFNDLAKLMDTPTRSAKLDVEVVEEQFSGIRLDPTPPKLIQSPDLPTEAIAVEEVDHTYTANIVVEPPPLAPLPPNTIVAPIAVGVPPVEVKQSISEEFDMAVDNESSSLQEATITMEESSTAKEFANFYIDTEPTPIDTPHRGPPPEVLQDDDEIIVYVAPHPRTGRSTPNPPLFAAATLPSTSILTGTTELSSTASIATVSLTSTSTPRRTPVPAIDSVSFAFTPTPKKSRAFTVGSRSRTKAGLQQRRQEAHALRRRMEQKMLFGSFGAIMSEAQLRGEKPGRDPRWEERRRGDSDIDWGDEDEEENEQGNGKSNGLAEGMDLDPELVGDSANALWRFAKSMSAAGSQFVTMDDIADGELMRREDEDVEDVGSSGDDEEDETTDDEEELNAVVNAEEEILIAEPLDLDLEEENESDEDDSDDDGNSPRANFQARLARLRNRPHGKGKGKMVAEDDDSDDDDDYFDRAEEDEDFIEEIKMMLEENEDILYGKDRKARNRLFRAVRNGAFEDLDDFKPAPKSKDKYKGLRPQLREQWQKDREKKAENKRARALARIELASDPLASHKGGKKGRKAMLAAAKLDPTITVTPNHIIDMTTLVQQIRRFLGDVGGPKSMSLPPTDKQTRKNIHEMAMAFGLKSNSKGKGEARYTTLTKTTKSGIRVDEKKVGKIVRWMGGRGGGEFVGGGKGGRVQTVVPKHKEGEEVGKAAPKIGESNVGFKLLAMMGWSEGQRIGVTGGLDVPLTAVIKNTKLGLGATR